MKHSRILAWIGYGSLVVLLALELVLRYDTWVRQIALSLTNLSTLAALWGLSRYMRARSATLPWPVIWFSALGVWFDGMGNFLHYYVGIGWWDKLAHAVGAGALAAGLFVLLAMLQEKGTILLGKKMRLLFVVSLTMLLAALYEISEYLGDLLFATNRMTTLYDTADDLVWNLAAALVVIVVAEWLHVAAQNRGKSFQE